MRNRILFVLLSISTLTFAQIDEDKSKWIIKWNTTSAIDIITFPTIQLSIEKRIYDYLSISGEAGLQLYNIGYKPDTSFINPQGFKINIECRIYLFKLIKPDLAGKKQGLYIGLQPFYRQNQYTSSISYLIKPDTINWKEDNFGVKNKTYGINNTVGFQRSFLDHFIMDCYLGIGIMQRNVKNTNREYNKNLDNLSEPIDLSINSGYFDLRESSGVSVNFILGFRVGYIF